MKMRTIQNYIAKQQKSIKLDQICCYIISYCLNPSPKCPVTGAHIPITALHCYALALTI